MAITFDGATKRVNLSAGTTTLGVRELWTAWVDWHPLSDNAKWPFALSQVGGNDIDTVAGTSIPIYCYLLNGWRIKPQEADHTLAVGDGVLLVDGGGDPFVSTTGDFTVRVNYQQPVQAITVATGGGGGLTSEQATMLSELHKRFGLTAGVPLVNTPTSITAGDVDLSVSQVGDTVTVERQ